MNFSTIGNAIKECFLKFKSKQSCGRWTLKMRDKSQTEKRFEPEIPSPKFALHVFQTYVLHGRFSAPFYKVIQPLHLAIVWTTT